MGPAAESAASEYPASITPLITTEDPVLLERFFAEVLDSGRRKDSWTARTIPNSWLHGYSARHGITRGETIYFCDPSGNRNEVFSGGYRTGKDFRTITWTTDQAARGVNFTHRELDQDFPTVVT